MLAWPLPGSPGTLQLSRELFHKFVATAVLGRSVRFSASRERPIQYGPHVLYPPGRSDIDPPLQTVFCDDRLHQIASHEVFSPFGTRWSVALSVSATRRTLPLRRLDTPLRLSRASVILLLAFHDTRRCGTEVGTDLADAGSHRFGFPPLSAAPMGFYLRGFDPARRAMGFAPSCPACRYIAYPRNVFRHGINRPHIRLTTDQGQADADFRDSS